MPYGPRDKPESIAHAFVEAWRRRDADGLAGLFDEDAEFVNVTGLWWHDRAAIRTAHAYGFERIFGASALRLMSTRVKMLADDIAVVHARVRLEGQTGTAQIARPGTRTTILSFVVHRRASADVWSCAAAQNTDIVPGMETNLVDADGSFRAVSYRAKP